jgi:ferredoxin-NADP reductase
MVEAVRGHIASFGVSPASFHYEKFTPAAVPETAEAA